MTCFDILNQMKSDMQNVYYILEDAPWNLFFFSTVPIIWNFLVHPGIENTQNTYSNLTGGKKSDSSGKK